MYKRQKVTGKKLGIIPFDSSLDEGDNLLFAGQKWVIKKIDKETLKRISISLKII